LVRVLHRSDELSLDGPQHHRAVVGSGHHAANAR
jgi:hypothetical protein